ncbi:unnamed protein product [Adineta ricciae]|uniref:Uncharacterized protein n=1 Tax=Adineta ricciae TaxID=249248 RepID=A0A814MUA4_ADIRI|nr:unnamed protein product [Adineta ricciae]CAF1083184.1 unnamed protein product [Adineta ricciae]
MFLRSIIILSIFAHFSAYGMVLVDPMYRKAELALNHYSASLSRNPIVYSLLNVLIHDQQAKAFVSDEAIELALQHIREFDLEINDHTEKIFRQIIYGVDCGPADKDCLSKEQGSARTPSPDTQQRIVAALDNFFEKNQVNEQ